MKDKKKIRHIWLTIRLNEEEENKLQKLFEKTTASTLSEYGRAILLQEPVKVIYHNQSAENFLAEMVLLKNELNAIGNNFNQAVKKLHTLNHLPEFKNWLLLNETMQSTILRKTEEIKEKLQQIYQQWSQK